MRLIRLVTGSFWPALVYFILRFLDGATLRLRGVTLNCFASAGDTPACTKVYFDCFGTLVLQLRSSYVQSDAEASVFVEVGMSTSPYV